MKVEIYSLTKDEFERRDYCNALQIKINGKDEFEVYDGEPEDNNLSRNFSDCFSIEKLMELAYLFSMSSKNFFMSRPPPNPTSFPSDPITR